MKLGKIKLFRQGIKIPTIPTVSIAGKPTNMPTTEKAEEADECGCETKPSMSETMGSTNSSVLISLVENAEGDQTDIEQALAELAGEELLEKYRQTLSSDEAQNALARSTNKQTYAKADKQKLFLAALFKLSKKHIDSYGIEDQTGVGGLPFVVDTDVESEAGLDVLAKARCQGDSPIKRTNSNAVHSKPKMTVKDCLVSMMSCTARTCTNVIKCNRTCGEVIDETIDKYDGLHQTPSDTGSVTISTTSNSLGSSLDRVFDGIAAKKKDEPLFSDESPKVLNLPISVRDVDSHVGAASYDDEDIDDADVNCIEEHDSDSDDDGEHCHRHTSFRI